MIRNEIQKIIQRAIKSRWDVDLDLEKIRIDYPPTEFGDYSTNVALVVAKKLGQKPMEIAKELTGHILGEEQEIITAFVEGINLKVAEPGFLNFFVGADTLLKELKFILEDGKNYGDSDIGEKKKIQVEFISANPTGPLTLGNGRGGFYGDVLGNVLQKAGFDIEREYYINDVGGQIEALGHSVLGDERAVYKGRNIEEVRAELDSRLRGNDKNDDGNDKESSAEEIGKEAARIVLEEMIKPAIEEKMRIKFDNWFSEESLYERGKVDKILDFLKGKNFAYEKDGALWFKSTEFGDDKDRVLIKADGEKTYLASDIAYLKNKFERGFDKLIYVWGADHHGYVSRLKAAAKALGYDPDNMKIIIMQLVRLMSGGREIKMSKRAGTYVTVDELLDEVGLDAARFFFLMHSPDAHMNFDLDLAKEQSEKNPVYYVQYAHARICSIFKKYGAEFDGKNVKLELLDHESEMKLIKQLIKFPEIIEDTAKDYQVHRLPHYALDLVRTFHKFYEDCRVLAPSVAEGLAPSAVEGIDEKTPDLTQARLSLVRATQIVLKNALDLIGISAPEKM
jgi:arginyl-tRNA synthetase